ncbi:MAG: hypothetical protein AAGG48_10170 [Planctomycetota bacterium]
MQAVNRFEFDLLSILQSVLGRVPVEQVLPKWKQPQAKPRGLHQQTVRLIEQMLAKGIVGRIARDDGWCRRRFLRDGEPVDGSLWQRTSPDQLGLTFSPQSIDLLLWLTSSSGSEGIPAWKPNPFVSKQDVTDGDRLIQYWIAKAAAETSLLTKWYRHEPFISNELISIALPDRFAEVDSTPALDFERWILNETSWLLEVLQNDFERWLVRAWNVKNRLIDADRVLAMSRIEDGVLQHYLRAADACMRPDLCRFVLMAARHVLHESLSVRDWLQSVNLNHLKAADRMEFYRAAATLPRAVNQMAQWHRNSATVHFLDDDYQASQLLKSIWESMDGDRLNQQAERMLAELEF